MTETERELREVLRNILAATDSEPWDVRRLEGALKRARAVLTAHEGTEDD